MLDKFKEHGGIELAYPALGISRYETPQFGPPPDTSGNTHGPHPSKKADWNPL